MKKLLLCIFFCCSLSAFSVHFFEQQIIPQNGFDSLEVILSVSSKSENAQTGVRSVLQNMTGVKLIAFCDNHEVFFIYIDKNIFSSKKVFLEQLRKFSPNYALALDLKEGSFADLMSFCSYDNPEDAATVKRNYNR